MCCICVFFFKQKTAYELRISDWSSDVCSSDLFAGMMGLRPWRWLNEMDDESAVLGWRPQIDIKEESERYLVRADIPGVDPKDIEITLEGGMLTIRGTIGRASCR